jgi:hypothetical protein
LSRSALLCLAIAAVVVFVVPTIIMSGYALRWPLSPSSCPPAVPAAWIVPEAGMLAQSFVTYYRDRYSKRKQFSLIDQVNSVR